MCNSYGQIVVKNINTIESNNFPKEKVLLKTNANVILSGEVLYYKLYCLLSNNNLSAISKIAYVELLGESNTILFKHKLKLVNGLASGDFFIPSNTQTGNYKIIAYTKLMNNNKTPYFIEDVYIINPYILDVSQQNNQKQDSLSVSIQIGKGEQKTLDISDDGIQLNTDSISYKPRSKVSLKLKNNLGNSSYGNFSLSVRKVDSLEIINKPSRESNKPYNNYKPFYLPEIRGEIISGQIISKIEGFSAVDKIVSLSIPGKNYVYKNVKTDQDGKFSFNIYENYNDANLIIRVINEDKENYKIVLDDSSFKDYDKLNFSAVSLNPNIKNWLLKQSVNNQIENAYNGFKKDSIFSIKPNKVFYAQPTVQYNLDDYKRFPTLGETFLEVITEAAVRKINDTYIFKVYNYEKRSEDESKEYNPLVLVDGILTQNISNILSYACHEIESVNIVQGIYFYGPSISNGIIDIKTKKGDFGLENYKGGSNYFSLNVPKETKLYYHPNYRIEFEELERIPDYRNQLLWMPNIFLKSNKTVEFYTSDVVGVFEIILEGYTLTGKYIKSNTFIQVENDY